MATITLTDRISVRVTAKDSTETSNQNKTNGGNVASALGGSGLTDSEKEELGESLSETVTDENGTTYARSDKVAGVLKQIADAGKLSEPTEVHKGLTDENGVNWNLEHVYPAGDILIYTNAQNHNTGSLYDIESPMGTPSPGLAAFFKNQWNDASTIARVVVFSKENVWGNESIWYYNRDAATGNGRGGVGGSVQAMSPTINNVSYSLFYSEKYANSSSFYFNIDSVNQNGFIENNISESSDVYKKIVGYLFGAVEQSGGAKVDPTGKTDAQIQKDLEDFAALNNCKMTSESGDTYIAVTDANGNPLYFLGT